VPGAKRGIDLLEAPKSTALSPAENFTPAKQLPPQPGLIPPDLNLPNHTGGAPPKLPDMTITSSPGTPMPVEQLPPTVRPEAKPEDFIEIYPDQSDELAKGTVLESYPGGPETKDRVDKQVKIAQKVGGKDMEVWVGGFDEKTGLYRREKVLRPAGEKGVTGFVFPDVILRHVPTGRWIYLNDAAVYADGATLTPKEKSAMQLIEKFKRPEDYSVSTSKPKPGSTFDDDVFEDQFRDLWNRVEKGQKQIKGEH